MSTFGKTIRIYLKDGSVNGIKWGEITNYTIQSISCPRINVTDLVEYSEIKKPGIYFLFGQDPETNDLKAYIGESENTYERLQTHITNKDFWNEVVFFVSKDENLTKAHARYLESRLIQMAISANRYTIDNYNQSQPAALPRSDRDAMEEFLTYINLLLGVFGHRVLEPVTPTTKPRSGDLPSANDIIQGNKEKNTLPLTLSMSGLKANALQTDEGIVVLEGSDAALTSGSLNPGYQDIRQKLITNGTLRLSDKKYTFARNSLFTAPTAAAAIIVGYNTSGRTAWKDNNGKTLKELEEQPSNS